MALKDLVVALEQVRNEARALVDANPDGVDGEQKIALDGMLAKASELQGQIADARAYEEKKSDLVRLDSFLNEPQYRAPRAINNDDDGRKSLAEMGWEIKGGQAFVPTSLGPVPLYAEEVLFGDLPTAPEDAPVAAYMRQARAAMQPEYRKAYGRLLQLCVKHRNESMAFNMLSESERKALSEGTDSTGGNLVPPDIQAEMLVRLPQLAIMRRYAQVMNTSRDVMRWPAVKAHGTSGSIYSSGFVGDWAGETPAFSETDPAFEMLEIAIKKVRVATKLSNDFVADSAQNVLAFLARNGAENMALVEDNGFIAGLGTALQPLGILNCGISTVDVEGSTSNTISNTTSSTGSAPKLIDLEYAVPSQYLGNARWVMRRSVEGKIRKLVDAQGRFLWPALSGSGLGPTPRTIDGYPVENSEFMEADGTDAKKVILFGDLSQYVIAQRAQISTVILRERFADTDQIGIILFERVGGALWNTDALRIGIV